MLVLLCWQFPSYEYNSVMDGKSQYHEYTYLFCLVCSVIQRACIATWLVIGALTCNSNMSALMLTSAAHGFLGLS